MSTTRTDIHRPSAIVPADYEYVACEYLRERDCTGFEGDGDALQNHFECTHAGFSDHLHDAHNCHVCGSVNLIYAIVYYHAKSNVYIRVGADCAYKLGLGGTAQLNAFKKRLSEQAEVYAGKQKAQRILSERGLTALWDIAFATDRKGFRYEENTITDIVSKLVRYGSVSDRALSFAESLLGKIGQRAQVEAERAAQDEAAAPCPTGRVTVTGTVLTTKLQDGQWGSTLKFLVRDDSGFKVWSTIPGYNSVNRGDRVTFLVSVEPSRDDPKFGFGKRPAKLTNLTAEAQQAGVTITA